MARARDPNRDKAFELYKNHNGRIDLVEIANQLNISSGTVRGWKSKDKWEDRLNGTFQTNTERSEKVKCIKKETCSNEVIEVTKNPELTDEQRLFCVYYIRCFNATKAYQKAYKCSYETAMAAGSRLLRNVKVHEEINQLKKERLNREFLSEEDIFQKYMDIAFSDITDYLEFGTREEQALGQFGPIEVKNPETGEKEPLMQTVNFIHLKKSDEVDGGIVSEISSGRNGVIVKLADRMKALQWLTDHMDMATEEQKARIAVLRAKSQINEEEEVADDGFIEALKGTAVEDWLDET